VCNRAEMGPTDSALAGAWPGPGERLLLGAAPRDPAGCAAVPSGGIAPAPSGRCSRWQGRLLEGAAEGGAAACGLCSVEGEAAVRGSRGSRGRLLHGEMVRRAPSPSCGWREHCSGRRRQPRGTRHLFRPLRWREALFVNGQAARPALLLMSDPAVTSSTNHCGMDRRPRPWRTDTDSDIGLNPRRWQRERRPGTVLRYVAMASLVGSAYRRSCSSSRKAIGWRYYFWSDCIRRRLLG
jgi:hypothetical protein